MRWKDVSSGIHVLAPSTDQFPAVRVEDAISHSASVLDLLRREAEVLDEVEGPVVPAASSSAKQPVAHEEGVKYIISVSACGVERRQKIGQLGKTLRVQALESALKSAQRVVEHDRVGDAAQDAGEIEADRCQLRRRQRRPSKL